MAFNITDIVTLEEPPVLGLLPPVALNTVMGLCALVNEALGILGIVANIINILVFYRQGYEDSVNITLTALAISDIGALVTLQITNVMVNPWFLTLDLSFDQVDFVSLVSFYPHNYFIRVCGFITAFASFERCLCVVLPLKVKQIITKRVSIATNIFIFVFLCLDLVPVYYLTYFAWTFIPELNITKLIGIDRENPYNVYGISYYFTDLFVPYFSFFVIIVCNVIVAIQLNRRAAWKRSVTGNKVKPGEVVSNKVKPGEVVSNKEKKVVLMLTVVATIFIVCLIPQSAVLTTVSFVPEISMYGEYFDVALLCYNISDLTETVSSSVNLVVYYKMSTRYRDTLHTYLDNIVKKTK